MCGARRPNIFIRHRCLASRPVMPRSPRATSALGAAAQHIHWLPLLGILPSNAKRSSRGFCAGRGGPTSSAIAVAGHFAQRRQEVLARLLRRARWPNTFICHRQLACCPATPRSPRATCAWGATSQTLHLSPSLGTSPSDTKKFPKGFSVGRGSPTFSAVTRCLAPRPTTPRRPRAASTGGATAQHLWTSQLIGILPSDAKKSPCPFCSGRGGPTP